MFGVDGGDDALEVFFVAGFAGEAEDIAGFGYAAHLHQPARAFRNSEQHEQEGGRNGGYAEFPAPFGVTEVAMPTR